MAELSGGMDSTSIVCIADHLATLDDSYLVCDTLSRFNENAEANWNEFPFFTLVEARRGRRGFHFEMSRYRGTCERPSASDAQYLYPGIDMRSIEYDRDVYTLTGGGYRSILSGIGGDEVTGGIPRPAVGVADLFLRGKLSSALKYGLAWSMSQRISLFSLLNQSASFVYSHIGSQFCDVNVETIPWLTHATRDRCRTVIGELPLQCWKPSITQSRLVADSETWWYTLRTQPHLKPSEVYRYEYRYPYLDRDLVEFMLQVPHDQLSRPGRRRFMMREALRGIVPTEILERKRKAFLLATPLAHMRDLAPFLFQTIEHSLLVEDGYVDRTQLFSALTNTLRGIDIRWWGLILRFALLETWLQRRARRGVLRDSTRDSVVAMADHR